MTKILITKAKSLLRDVKPGKNFVHEGEEYKRVVGQETPWNAVNVMTGEISVMRLMEEVYAVDAEKQSAVGDLVEGDYFTYHGVLYRVGGRSEGVGTECAVVLGGEDGGIHSFGEKLLVNRVLTIRVEVG